MTLLHDLMEESTHWKEQKSSYKDHYDRVYEHLIDSDWKDYVQNFKNGLFVTTAFRGITLNQMKYLKMKLINLLT